MNNLEAPELLNKVLPSLSMQNFEDSENDSAYISEIKNLQILSATHLRFDFIMPNDGVIGEVVIWRGILADKNKQPVYRGNLKSYEGTVDVQPGDLNFLKGAYTIAVTADSNLNTVGATQSILSGQSIQQGSSSLVVINKGIDSINTVFNRPTNAIASDDITWLILRKGNKPGEGAILAKQTSTPGTSSGVVPVHFNAGELKEGEFYNVVLNPGNTTRTFTAAYVFKYIIQ